ncbi:MAG TPA: SH3 domain-containing protein [Anaerolineae bacterium]|nr:SH3 domain-containing protein [Anaerolineae bacterium]
MVQFAQSSVRRGPDPAYSILVLAPRDQTYRAIGRTEDNTWIEVCCVEGQVGWISAKLIISADDLTTLPLSAAPNALAVVDGFNVALFGDPSYANPSIATIPLDTKMEITGRNGTEWLRVTLPTDAIEGWVYSGAVQIDGLVDTVPIIDNQ